MERLLGSGVEGGGGDPVNGGGDTTRTADAWKSEGWRGERDSPHPARGGHISLRLRTEPERGGSVERADALRHALLPSFVRNRLRP